jgi:hypothetical protein
VSAGRRRDNGSRPKRSTRGWTVRSLRKVATLAAPPAALCRFAEGNSLLGRGAVLLGVRVRGAQAECCRPGGVRADRRSAVADIFLSPAWALLLACGLAAPIVSCANCCAADGSAFANAAVERQLMRDCIRRKKALREFSRSRKLASASSPTAVFGQCSDADPQNVHHATGTRARTWTGPCGRRRMRPCARRASADRWRCRRRRVR